MAQASITSHVQIILLWRLVFHEIPLKSDSTNTERLPCHFSATLQIWAISSICFSPMPHRSHHPLHACHHSTSTSVTSRLSLYMGQWLIFDRWSLCIDISELDIGHCHQPSLTSANIMMSHALTVQPKSGHNLNVLEHSPISPTTPPHTHTP